MEIEKGNQMTETLENENETCLEILKIEEKLSFTENARKSLRKEKAVCCGAFTLCLAVFGGMAISANDSGLQWVYGLMGVFNGWFAAMAFLQFKELSKKSNLETHYENMLKKFKGIHSETARPEEMTR